MQGSCRAERNQAEPEVKGEPPQGGGCHHNFDGFTETTHADLIHLFKEEFFGLQPRPDLTPVILIEGGSQGKPGQGPFVRITSRKGREETKYAAPLQRIPFERR